jgi:hypothetical protein
MYEYQFLIVGAVLAAGSALFFAKAYLFPSFPYETARTFLGANPFQVRNGIIQRHEAIAGVIWLIGGLVAVLIGTVQTVVGGKIHYLIGPWSDMVILLAGGVVLRLSAVAITKWLSRRAYLPRMIEMQRELFDRDSFTIAHGGLYRDNVEVKGAVQPSAAILQERLADASRRLDQIGKLTDVPRRAGEADDQYVERLRPLFQSSGVTRRRS